jgi:glycosyltransferase involved in cell wall biosynthesis
MKTYQLISVVIPTYNRANVIGAAIQSVMRQTYQNHEIIVVDDASSDDTESVVKSFSDRKIIYVKHQQNSGAPSARNTGIEKARGACIAFLDSDDEWLSEKLEKQMEVFERSPQIGLVYTGFDVVLERGKVLRSFLKPDRGRVFERLLSENFIGTTSSAMAKRELLQKIGGFDPLLKSCQDWDLYLRLSQICDVDVVPEVLVKHHWEGNNRIMGKPSSVIQGHVQVQEKFRDAIKALPASRKIHHYNEMSFVYLNAGDLGLSLKMLGNALLVDGNPVVFLKMMKRIITFLQFSLIRKHSLNTVRRMKWSI